jgi:hypothetical protein
VLLIILGLFWVAILVPVVVRRFRDSGTERSIHSFHAEHEVLSRQEYSVPPANRLDASDQEENYRPVERPRLTVVHAGDTYRSLESRGSWEEWADDYDYDREDDQLARSEPVNRYVTAYSAVPNEREIRQSYDGPTRSASMRARRQVFFLSLAVAAALFTGLNFVLSSSFIEDLSILAWIGFMGYVALALFAVSQGYLYESSLPIRIPQGRYIASVEPLYAAEGEVFESEFYDSDDEGDWRRESPSRYAVG